MMDVGALSVALSSKRKVRLIDSDSSEDGADDSTNVKRSKLSNNSSIEVDDDDDDILNVVGFRRTSSLPVTSPNMLPPTTASSSVSEIDTRFAAPVTPVFDPTTSKSAIQKREREELERMIAEKERMLEKRGFLSNSDRRKSSGAAADEEEDDILQRLSQNSLNSPTGHGSLNASSESISVSAFSRVFQAQSSISHPVEEWKCMDEQDSLRLTLIQQHLLTSFRKAPRCFSCMSETDLCVWILRFASLHRNRTDVRRALSIYYRDLQQMSEDADRSAVARMILHWFSDQATALGLPSASKQSSSDFGSASVVTSPCSVEDFGLEQLDTALMLLMWALCEVVSVMSSQPFTVSLTDYVPDSLVADALVCLASIVLDAPVARSCLLRQASSFWLVIHQITVTDVRILHAFAVYFVLLAVHVTSEQVTSLADATAEFWTYFGHLLMDSMSVFSSDTASRLLRHLITYYGCALVNVLGNNVFRGNPAAELTGSAVHVVTQWRESLRMLPSRLGAFARMSSTLSTIDAAIASSSSSSSSPVQAFTLAEMDSHTFIMLQQLMSYIDAECAPLADRTIMRRYDLIEVLLLLADALRNVMSYRMDDRLSTSSGNSSSSSRRDTIPYGLTEGKVYRKRVDDIIASLQAALRKFQSGDVPALHLKVALLRQAFPLFMTMWKAIGSSAAGIQQRLPFARVTSETSSTS
jgi:hypothetical protein